MTPTPKMPIGNHLSLSFRIKLAKSLRERPNLARAIRAECSSAMRTRITEAWTPATIWAAYLSERDRRYERLRRAWSFSRLPKWWQYTITYALGIGATFGAVASYLIRKR